MLEGWDSSPKTTTMLPDGEAGELFRITKNPELFNQETAPPRQFPVRPAAPASSNFGEALGSPDYRASAPTLETQIENINNQTVRAATGKQQEAATMSDLQKMAQAYFGGRTQEQKRKEAFMNIAAGLAMGKSPRFMDNLGTAVGGALNFQRDDTNRREKEALDGFIKIQGQDDDRVYQQGQIGLGAERNDISREQNDISRINATRERASTNYQMKALQQQAGYLSKAIAAAEAAGQDSSELKVSLGEVMTQLGGAGGVGMGDAPAALGGEPSRPRIKMGADGKAVIAKPQ